MANDELKTATETIRTLEANYHTLLEENADAIVIVNQSGIIRFANAAVAELFGRDAVELHGELFDFPVTVGKKTEITITRNGGETAIAQMRVMETNWQGENAYLVLLRDITEYGRLETALKKSEEGRRRLLKNTNKNISREFMEEELRGTEEKYAILTNILNIGVYRNTVGSEGKFIEMNTALVRMFGYKNKAELLTMSVADLYQNPKDRKAFSERLSRVGLAYEELLLKKKDGTPLVCMVSAVASRDEEGQVIYFDGIIEDITERKRAKEALREISKRETQARAQGRLEVVDTILHNIGNAINNVTIGIDTIQVNLTNNRLTRRLTSLANAVAEHQDDFSDYVKNHPQGQKVAPFIIALADDFARLDEELAKTVHRVWERAEHIADIIRTVKAVSGKPYRKDINLQKAMDNARAVLQDTIEKRDIQVIVDCTCAPEEISIQESPFSQMLVNLVKNSIEAIDDLEARANRSEKPFIKIKCFTEPGILVLEVSDNGIGIQKDKLDVIFRSGYTTKESGSGLGLHSIANFVKGCNGQIAASSDGIGKGATMRIELPLA